MMSGGVRREKQERKTVRQKHQEMQKLVVWCVLGASRDSHPSKVTPSKWI